MKPVAPHRTERGSAGYIIQLGACELILPGATALGSVRALNV